MCFFIFNDSLRKKEEKKQENQFSGLPRENTFALAIESSFWVAYSELLSPCTFGGSSEETFSSLSSPRVPLDRKHLPSKQ